MQANDGDAYSEEWQQEQEFVSRRVTKTYVVAVYEVDRVFGGHEEGGWWYTTGQLVRPVRIVHNEEKAYDLCRRYNHLLRLFTVTLPKRRDMYSMAYNGGQLSCYVHEDNAPKYFPEERPHYE